MVRYAPRPHPHAVLDRLATALATARVGSSWKADDELADLGWSTADATDVLAALTVADVLRTEPSRSVDWIRLAEDAGGTLVIRFQLAERDPRT